jgi:hypothetical protein
MKTTCPACGAVASLDVLIGHEGARDAVMVALSLPAPLGKLLVQYVAMFRPPKRNLSMDRLASLLGELQPDIAAAKIERGGRIWSAPQDYWRMGLEEIVAKRDKLTLPLKSHGYLLEIICGYSNKAEAKQEAAVEARRGGHTPVGAPSPSASLPPLPRAGEGKGERVRGAMPDHVKAALKGGKPNANT